MKLIASDRQPTRRLRALPDATQEVGSGRSDPRKAVAKEFYGERVGLEVLIETEQFLTFRTGGDSRLVVTKSTTGTQEEQTKASWRVDDIAAPPRSQGPRS